MRSLITFLITGFAFAKVILLPLCVCGGDNDPEQRKIFIAWYNLQTKLKT